VVYAEQLARELALRHEVIVVTALLGDDAEDELVDGMRIIRVPVLNYDSSKWLSFSYRVGRFLAEFVRVERIDILHFLDCHLAHNYQGDYVATLFQSFRQRAGSNQGLPYFSSLANLFVRYPYYIFSMYLEKKSVKNARSLIASSESTLNEFVKNYEISTPLASVVHLGIDTDFYQPKNSDIFRREFNLQGKRIIAFVGFMGPRKGIEHLLKAVVEMNRNDCALVLVGRWDAKYREKLLPLLEQASEYVVEAGYIPDNQIPELYSSADVLVLPSLLEGFGYPLVEAMACGTVPVGTDAGSIPELITGFGEVVPPQDSTALAAAISGILDKECSNETRASLRQHVCQNFGIDSMVKKTVSRYEEYLDEIKGALT
jgi:MMP alpha-(1->4)-mannosyltransferase